MKENYNDKSYNAYNDNKSQNSTKNNSKNNSKNASKNNYSDKTENNNLNVHIISNFLRGFRSMPEDVHKSGKFQEHWCQPRYDRSCGIPIP